MTSLLADDRLFEMEGESSVAPSRAPAGAAKTFRPTFGKFGTRWGAANRCGFTSGLRHQSSYFINLQCKVGPLSRRADEIVMQPSTGSSVLRDLEE
jgi:hypothetical protein